LGALAEKRDLMGIAVPLPCTNHGKYQAMAIAGPDSRHSFFAALEQNGVTPDRGDSWSLVQTAVLAHCHRLVIESGYRGCCHPVRSSESDYSLIPWSNRVLSREQFFQLCRPYGKRALGRSCGCSRSMCWRMCARRPNTAASVAAARIGWRMEFPSDSRPFYSTRGDACRRLQREVSTRSSSWNSWRRFWARR